MRVQVFSPPKNGETFEQNKIGDIQKITDFSYEQFFNGIGSFSLTFPRSHHMADKIEPRQYIYASGHSLIIKGVQINDDTDTVTITGTDLKGLLSQRHTEYGAEQVAGADGFDVKKGTTEEIIKYYITKNLVSPTNAKRKIPLLRVLQNQNRGLAKDSYMARLENIAELVHTMCSNADIGYTVDINLANNTIDFDVVLPKENEITLSAKHRKNANSANRKIDVSAEKNTYYTEISDGTTQTIHADTEAEGIERDEVYLQVNCELDEIDIYAKKSAEDYIKTDLIELTATNPSHYGDLYTLGDIVNVKVGGKVIRSMISYVRFNYTADQTTIEINVGEEAPRLLNAIQGTGAILKKRNRESPGYLPAKIQKEVTTLVTDLEGRYDTAISGLEDGYGEVVELTNDLRTDVNGMEYEVGYLHASLYNDVDGVYKQLTDHSTEIGIIAGQITSKVSQDDYDEYVSITGDTITQIESDLSAVEQTASSISATVAGQSVLIDGLQTSYADQQAQINVQAGLISQTVTKTEFNNLQIGGRNLVRNGDFSQGIKYWTGGINSQSSANVVDGVLEIVFDKDTSQKRLFYDILNLASYGTDITISADIKADENDTLYLGQSGNIKPISVTTEWRRYSTTLPYETLNQYTFGFYYQGAISENTFYIDNVKLEKGNKATDWTPAPEDIDSAIATVDGKFVNYSTTTQMQSAITQSKSEVLTTVSGTYATQATVEAVDGKFSDYYTKTQNDAALSVRDEAINLRVTQSTYNAGMATKANQSALDTTNDNLASLTTRVDSAELKITDSAIVSTVRSSTQYTNDLNEKTNKNEIISTINQSSEAVSISASKINLNGAVTANNNFKINLDGSMETVAGKIAGLTMKDDMLYSGSDNNTILLKSSGEIRLAVGLPLSMIQAGSSAVDGNYHAVSTATYLTQDGLFKSGNAEISGKITTSDLTASGGKIGTWNITSTHLYSGTAGDNNIVFLAGSTSDYALWAGNANATIAPLQLKKDGTGKMGNWTISTNHLYSGSGDNIVFLAGSTSDYALWAGNANATIAPLQLKKDGTGKMGSWTISTNHLYSGSGDNIVFLAGSTSDYALWAGNANATIAPLQIKKDGAITSSGSTVSTHINGGSLKFRYSSTVAGGISATNITGVGVALNLECSVLSMNGMRAYTQTIPVVTPTGAKNLYFRNGIFIGTVEEI